MAMLDRASIQQMGFSRVGENVQISDRASFYRASRIKIGNNVRIDDYCVLSAGEGGIEIGNHVHIAVGATLIGAGAISICDFANISSRVSIYSSSDDYSGATLTNPTVPEEYKNVLHAPVFLGRHVLIGSGAVVLPGVRLGEGVAVGALSLVNRDCAEFGIYAGVPAKRVKEREKRLLQLEKKFLKNKKLNALSESQTN
uniref:acyltransferase n=1 Tax=uncultured Altererythrobacter sp. TaxID=500840 RepID=UPI002603831B|nr:acyltransferase [uncultured Altererythrobacter sp.]